MHCMILCGLEKKWLLHSSAVVMMWSTCQRGRSNFDCSCRCSCQHCPRSNCFRKPCFIMEATHGPVVWTLAWAGLLIPFQEQLTLHQCTTVTSNPNSGLALIKDMSFMTSDNLHPAPLHFFRPCGTGLLAIKISSRTSFTTRSSYGPRSCHARQHLESHDIVPHTRFDANVVIPHTLCVSRAGSHAT